MMQYGPAWASNTVKAPDTASSTPSSAKGHHDGVLAQQTLAPTAGTKRQGIL